MSKKFVAISTAALFIVLFNVGFVFHEPLMGTWFHQQEAAIVRDNFIIPYIALAYLVYCFLLSYFYPMYVDYNHGSPRISTALRFGVIMGVLFDALQGELLKWRHSTCRFCRRLRLPCFY